MVYAGIVGLFSGVKQDRKEAAMTKPDPKLVERVCKRLEIRPRVECGRKRLAYLSRCLEEHCPYLKFGPTQRMIRRCRYRTKHYPQGNDLSAEIWEKLLAHKDVWEFGSNWFAPRTPKWEAHITLHRTKDFYDGEGYADTELEARLLACDKAFCKETENE